MVHGAFALSDGVPSCSGYEDTSVVGHGAEKTMSDQRKRLGRKDVAFLASFFRKIHVFIAQNSNK